MHQYHGIYQQWYYQNPRSNYLPFQTSVTLMLFLFPAFFFVGFFHNQIITCRKHSRTNLSGSQLLFLIRNGQCIGSKINGTSMTPGNFFYCFFYIIGTSCTMHIKHMEMPFLLCYPYNYCLRPSPPLKKKLGKNPCLFIETS